MTEVGGYAKVCWKGGGMEWGMGGLAAAGWGDGGLPAAVVAGRELGEPGDSAEEAAAVGTDGADARGVERRAIGGLRGHDQLLCGLWGERRSLGGWLEARVIAMLAGRLIRRLYSAAASCM